MFSKLFSLHWTWIVIIGAPANVLINYGYKVIGAQAPVLWVITGVFAVVSVVLLFYALLFKRTEFEAVTSKNTSIIISLMGIGAAVSAVCFVTALTVGPISLVDPLWACIYAIISLLVGMLVVRERPNKIALLGIGFYLLGAALMAQG